MPTEDPCVFCSIINGSAPAYRVYEDEATLAFLDIGPFTRGHTLVVPKIHARTLLDMAPDRAGRLMESAARVAALLRDALTPDGFTLLQANEPAGWQTVFHVHVHVIPRWVGDGIAPPAMPTRTPDDLAAVARAIVAAGPAT